MTWASVQRSSIQRTCTQGKDGGGGGGGGWRAEDGGEEK